MNMNKMTKDKKIEILTMRVNGYSVRKICKATGFSKQCIYNLFYSLFGNLSSCVYENVRIWLIENEMDYEELAEKINFNVDHLIKILSGKMWMPVSIAKKISKVSGIDLSVIMEVAAENNKRVKKKSVYPYMNEWFAENDINKLELAAKANLTYAEMIKLLNGRTENMSDKQILRFQKAIANAINVDVNTAFAM